MLLTQSHVTPAPRRCRGRDRPTRLAARACAAPPSASLEEVLQFEFGVVNKDARRALLRERSVATASADALRSKLATLRTLLTVSPADFECCLCVCDPKQTGALLELGPRAIALRMAELCAVLPPGCDAGKIVGAAPALILQDQPGARVSAALDALRATGADPAVLAQDRPGSFGGVLVKLCRAGAAGSIEHLEPFLRAWVMDRK